MTDTTTWAASLHDLPIAVYHGPTMYDPYVPGEMALAKVGEFTIVASDLTRPDVILERAWAAMNGHPRGVDQGVTDAYYNGHRRSLCMGDVIVFAETAYTCMSMGWEAVALDPADIKEPGDTFTAHGRTYTLSTDDRWNAEWAR